MIRDVVEKASGVNLTKRVFKRNYTHARGVYYLIASNDARAFTLSAEAIGFDRSSAYHVIRNRESFMMDGVFKNLYLVCLQRCEEITPTIQRPRIEASMSSTSKGLLILQLRAQVKTKNELAAMVSRNTKIDKILHEDAQLYQNLGLESTPQEIKEVREKSMSNYRRIRSIDKDLGDLLLHATSGDE